MALAAVLTAFCSGAEARPRAVRHSDVQVYLLRGLMNVWSTGLDDLAAKLRARGLRASVYNHIQFGSVARNAIAGYRSGKLRHIVLIGHSFGGNAAMSIADVLNQANVPVDLVILYDPSFGTTTSPNVHKLVNFYVSKGVGGPAVRQRNFRGTLQNIDESGDSRIDHLNIEKASKLHNRAMRLIYASVDHKQSVPRRQRSAMSSDADQRHTR